MSLSIGIVGLPNVGKSTLFNALTKHQAEASNYPFCTIDPNVGVVEVPDKRLDALRDTVNPQKVIPAAIEFVDIAGLVREAHKGEGLGNKFLSHIREVDAICHVVRFFEDENITHVDGSVDPRRDIETIRTELALSDLSTAEKRRDRAQKETKTGDKLKKQQLAWAEEIVTMLGEGKWVSDDPAWLGEKVEAEKRHFLKELNLLTAKPVMYAVNLPEEKVAGFDVAQFASAAGLGAEEVIVPVSAQVEQELTTLDATEAAEYLEGLGLTESGLVRLIQAGYRLLDLITYFTAGEKEVRAWTIDRGTLAPQAAGVIHTDFEQKFIRVEVIPWDKLQEASSYPAARDKGWLRTEGKTYEMQDGDTVHFLHGA